MLSTEKLTVGSYARTYLLTIPAIAAIVGSRIYPGIAPEGTAGTFVVYERDSYEVLNSKMGIYLQEANIAYEVISDTYDEGQALAVLILENLQGRHNNLNFQVVDSAEYYTEKKYRQVLLFKIN